jgi:hypothetical protein
MFRCLSTVFILAAITAASAHAHDSQRLDQLENEIRELKQRISALESPRRGSRDSSLPITPGDGWKTVDNWRKLRRGMRPIEVRRVLGEAHRVEGGYFTRWFYQNDGVVTFANEELNEWKEPPR